ncbi:hypothetical protein [Maribacter sp. LLG6340-A2]|uniref:hypothetical protein n=1 Tax=Maribacter sp. LLG6340-A2 TaxID=3160834 RepID=UPI0038632788
MKLNLLLVIFLLICNSLIAQINYQNEQSGTFQTGNIDSPFLRVSKSSGNKIVGSIYLNEEWEQATISDNAKKTYKSMARFNAYHSEIEILTDNKVKALVADENLEVSLNERLFTPINLPSKIKPIFAEKLVSGEYSLYKVYDIKINKAPSDAKLLNLESNDKVVIYSELYFMTKDKIQKVPNSKKESKKLLPNKMIALANKEKLSIKKDQDVIEIFKLYNAVK